MNRRLGAPVLSALLLGAAAAGCGASAGAAPGSTSGSVFCPLTGPVKASDLDQLAPCDLSGMEIVMDVWAHEDVGGTVQNVGSCSEAGEGTPVVVCTFAAPVGTGGYVGAGSARVWFGTEAAITQVRSTSR